MITQVITETEFESRLHIHAFYPLNYTTFLNGLYSTIKRQRFIHSVFKNSHHRVLSSLNLRFWRFIDAANYPSSVIYYYFLLASISKLYKYTMTCLFISCGGPLICFQFGATVNKETVSILSEIFLWTQVLILSAKEPRNEIAVSQERYMFNLIRNCKFSKMIVQFYILNKKCVRVPVALHHYQHLCYCLV